MTRASRASTAPAPAAPHTLSDRLRAETRDAHTRAERSGVMRRLVRGAVDRAEYVALLADLAAVYDALERELDRRAAELPFSTFALAALRRLPALLADIETLRAPGTPAPPPSAAALDYAARLHALGAGAPTLLLAHAYVRYLGDLSGGQILRPLVRRALGIDGDAGTTFYEFDDDPDVLKERFRVALDALPAADADALVAEARAAFERNEALFTARDAER